MELDVYIEEVYVNLIKFGEKNLCEVIWEKMKVCLYYVCVDMKDVESYCVLDDYVDLSCIMVCYLVMLLVIYGDICCGLYSCKIIDLSVCVVLEKLIGYDLVLFKVINE